jgi:hypothetical protein
MKSVHWIAIVVTATALAAAVPSIAASEGSSAQPPRRVARTARSSILEGSVKRVDVTCPRGSLLVGGGFATQGDVVVMQSAAGDLSPSLTRPTRWSVVAANPANAGAVQSVVTAQAICLVAK